MSYGSDIGVMELRDGSKKNSDGNQTIEKSLGRGWGGIESFRRH